MQKIGGEVWRDFSTSFTKEFMGVKSIDLIQIQILGVQI